MTTKVHHMFGHTLLRVTIGLLFLIQGIMKFINPEKIIGMLQGIGFPASTFLGWILIFSEAIFGALVLVGYKVEKTAWPLAFILAVAAITVSIPTSGFSSPNSFFHYIAIAGLITIALTGPGKWAINNSH